MIWKQEFTLEGINQICQSTMVDHLGIEFTNFGDDYLEATMPLTTVPYNLRVCCTAVHRWHWQRRLAV